MRRKNDGTLGFITNRRLNNEQAWLETRIARLKGQQGFYIKGAPPPHNTHAKLKAVREAYHNIPKAIEAANAGRRRVNSQGFQRLDGQCGNALRRRNVDGKIGAEFICVDFSVVPNKCGVYTIEPVRAWYAPQWFTMYANSMRDRKHMYRRFDKLKDSDQDTIDSEIGLLILGAT
jgi:hypothetical protein